MVELRSLAIFKKREVYQFIMFMNFWGGGLFQRFFGMFTPAKLGKMRTQFDEPYFFRWVETTNLMYRNPQKMEVDGSDDSPFQLIGLFIFRGV